MNSKIESSSSKKILKSKQFCYPCFPRKPTIKTNVAQQHISAPFAPFVAWGIGGNCLSNCWGFCLAISDYVDWGLAIFGDSNIG